MAANTGRRMSTASKAAVVTGANKGIGFGIVRELSKQFQGTVYLTARDVARGEDAVHLLKDEGLQAQFLQLDVTDKKSIEKARDFLVKKHGGLDILVNNAGVYMGSMADKDKCTSESCHQTLATNFYGLLDVCKVLFPILRPHARVVNVASSLGNLRNLKIDALKQRLVSDDLTVEEIEKAAADFLKVADEGNPVEAGYPPSFTPYAFSKVLVIALSRVQQRLLDIEGTDKDIVVNAVCPGFVATDLNQHQGIKSIEQGADSPVYLALLPPQNQDLVRPRGQFVYERLVKDWAGGQ